MQFTASAIQGSGRGKGLGTPTINLNRSDVPSDLQEGIYVCTVTLDGDSRIYGAAMHYGPRPVFDDVASCELHLIDTTIDYQPESISVRVLKRLRDIEHFESTESLIRQMAEDVDQSRAILRAHDPEA